ncbi:hypothetical protein BUALT_Bualt04G0034300 [Buddleja alternifolia]|uniref:BED-type domain-containing protein n=1 Tax=Buddleja alternifolia TaxID=168488 RepID=A0AAV6XWU7_9LAMI|nr:hypothetical protein BUALT_Bualt04G0034300 [Buddleja alternifolia]
MSYPCSRSPSSSGTAHDSARRAALAVAANSERASCRSSNGVEIIAPLTFDEVPPEILHNLKYYPFFKMESQGVESVQSINHRDENTKVEMMDVDNHEEGGATLETDDIPQESGKRKQTSKMWEHFKKVKVDDIQYAECKYCKNYRKAPPGFGTTSLFKHYQKACKRHPRGLDIRQSLIKTTPHTAEVLCDLLADALMDWNIDRKVSKITVDNCTTNDAMLRRLLDRLSTKDILLDRKVLHMHCCAHILNLIVKDGLETISITIGRIRDSVVYWTASPARVEKFEEVARQLNKFADLKNIFKSAKFCRFEDGKQEIVRRRRRFVGSSGVKKLLMCAHRWLWNEGNGTCSKFSSLEACPTMLDEEEDEETFVETL